MMATMSNRRTIDTLAEHTMGRVESFDGGVWLDDCAAGDVARAFERRDGAVTNFEDSLDGLIEDIKRIPDKLNDIHRRLGVLRTEILEGHPINETLANQVLEQADRLEEQAENLAREINSATEGSRLAREEYDKR